MKVVRELFGQIKSRVGRENYGKEKAQLIILNLLHQFSKHSEGKIKAQTCGTASLVSIGDLSAVRSRRVKSPLRFSQMLQDRLGSAS